MVGGRGYGFSYPIAIVPMYGIDSRLSPRGSGPGEQRCVVERTMSWWTRFRRIDLRYERDGEHFQGRHELAACVLRANILEAARADKPVITLAA